MRILIRGTNWIGDAVMTIPAIRKLRLLFPEARLTLQTREWARGIFEQSDLVDEIITSESIFDQVTSHRSQRFDLAVVFPNSFSSAFGVRLTGAKRRFGYAAERRSFLLTDPIAMPDWKDRRHEVYYYLELIDEIEKRLRGQVTETRDLEPRFDVAELKREKARQILRDSGADQRSKIVALAPGSTNSRAKRWIPERFAQLSDRLQSESNCSVVLLGSKDDREISQKVLDAAQIKPIDLTGVTDIVGAAAILGEVDLLVSNDMGLAHLAPAVGTETIVIFGPTNQITTRPFSEKATIISANVECAPCMLRDCPIDHRCMTRVTVDEVFEKARKQLAISN